MPVEIERKFLVNSDFPAAKATSEKITQGYLCSVPSRTVRVRARGERGYITVKGIGNASGASRFEWEHEIPVNEARELLALCEPGVIDKTRYTVSYCGHIFEIDQFHESNAGLVIAEVELRSEDESFAKPEWLGREVTGDKRYYNAMLSKKSFQAW